MAFSGRTTQVVRGDASQPPRSRRKRRSVAMPAMPMVTAAFMPAVPAAVAHREAAFRAQLPVLTYHASSDFMFIRNEFAAKRQCIVLTDLAGVALGGGAMDAGYDRSETQYQCQSCKMRGPHCFPQYLLQGVLEKTKPLGGCRRRSLLPGAKPVVDGRLRGLCQSRKSGKAPQIVENPPSYQLPQCPRPQANSVWCRPDASRGGHGATLPATSWDVALSNDMWRQKALSGSE